MVQFCICIPNLTHNRPPTSTHQTCQVTRWLSTCGNAVVEGLEECDDGDLYGGDGCGPTCRIEPGYECTGSPSVCHRKSNPQPGPAPSPPSDSPTPAGPQPSPSGPAVDPSSVPSDSGAGGGSGSSAKEGSQSYSAGKLVVGILLLVACGAVIGTAVAFRSGGLQRFPQVREGDRGLHVRHEGWERTRREVSRRLCRATLPGLNNRSEAVSPGAA